MSINKDAHGNNLPDQEVVCTGKFWIVITLRNYEANYDEEGYQVGRHISHSQTVFYTSDSADKLLEIEDKASHGCDETYDISSIYSPSLDAFLNRRKEEQELGELDSYGGAQ